MTHSMHRQTDRQTDKQTDRQTQTERQTKIVVKDCIECSVSTVDTGKAEKCKKAFERKSVRELVSTEPLQNTTSNSSLEKAIGNHVRFDNLSIRD